MKRIRLLRGPEGGNHVSKVERMLTLNLGETATGTVLEVPDEIAALLCAPRCPECGSVFPDLRIPTDGVLICPRIHETDGAGEPIHDLEGADQQLRPGLAVEVEER